MDKEAAKKKVVIVTQGTKAKKIRIPERIENISLKWLVDAPFFSEFLLRFTYFKSDDIPTMGVNSTKGRINLYMNEGFMNGGVDMHTIELDKDGFPVILKDDDGNSILDANGNLQVALKEIEHPGLTDLELEGVLVHEIMHLIRLHMDRGQDSDFSMFNIAADMCINEEIRGSSGDYSDNMRGLTIGRRNIKLPEGALYIDLARKDGYDGELISEPIYTWLIEKREEYKKKQKEMQENGSSGDCNKCGGDGKEKDENGNKTGNDCPDCGGSGKQNGQGEPGDGGKGGGAQSIEDLFETTYGGGSHEILEASDNLAESTVKDITDNAIARGWGNISGNFSSNIEELLKPTKINWKALLRKHIMSHIYGHGTIKENKWSRRNRRSLPLPGKRKLSKRIVIGVDTSGSVDEESLKQFFTEIETIVKDVSSLTVIQWDTDIKGVWKEYKKGDFRKIKVKGRGGTAVQCIFDWMIENKRKEDLLLNFTDGYFYEVYDTHGIKNIWCCTTDQTPSGGKTIKVDVN